MRYQTLKARAERYATEEMGWKNAEAIDAKPAGKGGRACAVLMDTGVQSGGQSRFVIAFSEWDQIVTDAGLPEDFGWEEE